MTKGSTHWWDRMPTLMEASFCSNFELHSAVTHPLRDAGRGLMNKYTELDRKILLSRAFSALMCNTQMTADESAGATRRFSSGAWEVLWG